MVAAPLTVDIPAAVNHKLLFVLLDRYAGRTDAVNEFDSFYENEGIEHKWGDWV